MSHFVVLVIGENIEDQLDPYEEKDVEPYVEATKQQAIEMEKKRIQKYKEGIYAEYLKDPEAYAKDCMNPKHLEYLEHEFPKKLKWTDEEIYQNEVLQFKDPEEVGPNGEIYSTYNPKSKWDWYLVGGRWTGALPLKLGAYGVTGTPGVMTNPAEEGWVDQARKGDIDWPKIHQTKKKYDEAIEYWEVVVEGKKPPEGKSRDFFTMWKPKFYKERYGNKETFAKCCSNFTMWAIVKDGKWIEKGDMGWWGISSETNEEALDWELNFYDTYIKPLPDDTLLTVVDCHI
jgi:hypothetical protein